MSRGHQLVFLVAPLLFACGFGDDGDRFPPIVTITSPSTQIVRGTVAFSADVSDDSGVIPLVRFFVGNTLLFTDDHAPFTTDWDTTTVPDGEYLLRAQALDSTGNAGSAGKLVMVSNLPPNTPGTAGR